MKKIKLYISYVKNYFRILTTFEKLNEYIFNSSIFLTRLENILYSNELNEEQKLLNIEMSYSDFKVNNLEENFDNGVVVNNDFNKEV